MKYRKIGSIWADGGDGSRHDIRHDNDRLCRRG